MDAYQQYIHISRYSRWRPELGRRETWDETVQRYIDFFDNRTDKKYTCMLNGEVKDAIFNLQVMPSMRALMSAGAALERDNIAGYNCAYTAVNRIRVFAESLYILMCGAGVGFSCERQEITNLPTVPDKLEKSRDVIVVGDSKEGWAKALNAFLCHVYDGSIPKVDYSNIRPAGERLKVFGGRASGPKPFQKLIRFITEIFLSAKGRKLNSLEVHDIMCMIGEIVVVGGVRRSALISLSNLSDQRMRDAKAGQWWDNNPQRALANNSVAYTEKPSCEIFMEEWLSLVKSKSGERGIFNRVAAQKQAAKFGFRSEDYNYGCNPCSEIILRDKQFCNLTEVVIKSDDTLETLRHKVEVATILGTFQATLTDFGFIDDEWKKNTEEEALLGVSLTGILDCALTTNYVQPFNSHDVYLPDLLDELRNHARETNAMWAKELGINASAAITCVKPSGTVSQLCDSASGIHPRHAKQYIRTVRVDKKDPLYKFMRDKDFSIEDDIHKPDDIAVISFPIESPTSCITRDDMSAIESLELWLVYQRHWCEHKPSVTITVRESEWLEVGAWVYAHFDEVSGISFLPHSDHTYSQAPYQAMERDEFLEWLAENPKIEVDWRELSNYEKEDNTEGAQTLACSGGSCEI